MVHVEDEILGQDVDVVEVHYWMDLTRVGIGFELVLLQKDECWSLMTAEMSGNVLGNNIGSDWMTAFLAEVFPAS